VIHRGADATPRAKTGRELLQIAIPGTTMVASAMFGQTAMRIHVPPTSAPTHTGLSFGRWSFRKGLPLCHYRPPLIPSL